MIWFHILQSKPIKVYSSIRYLVSICFDKKLLHRNNWLYLCNCHILISLLECLTFFHFCTQRRNKWPIPSDQNLYLFWKRSYLKTFKAYYVIINPPFRSTSSRALAGNLKLGRLEIFFQHVTGGDFLKITVYKKW